MLAASKIIHDPQLHIRDPLLQMPSHDIAAAELAVSTLTRDQYYIQSTRCLDPQLCSMHPAMQSSEGFCSLFSKPQDSLHVSPAFQYSYNLPY